LSFILQDADTGGGYVRATVHPEFSGPADEYPILDEFRLTSPTVAVTDTLYFHVGDEGGWTMEVQAWDVGGSHAVTDSISFTCGLTSGLGERRIYVPELKLHRGRPNPSNGWVAWDLQGAGHAVDLRVVSVDGRCVRSWPTRTVPDGTVRILWNGLDDRGAKVAAGRYYLIATDHAGKVASMSATIVR
jgi:hypothetical protein